MDPFSTPVIADVAFWLVSSVTLLAALGVVIFKDLFRAAVSLSGSFLGAAGIYVLLSAEFIAAVHILVYVGAISVVIAFAVMFARDPSLAGRSRGRAWLVVSGFTGLVVFVAIAAAAVFTEWSSISDIQDQNAISGLVGSYVEQPRQEGGNFSAIGLGSDSVIVSASENEPNAQSGVLVNSTSAIGTVLLRDFLLPFEVAGVIIVAAVLGAIAIMRGSLEPEDPPSESGG